MAHSSIKEATWKEVVDGIPSYKLGYGGQGGDIAWIQMCGLGLRAVLLLADRNLDRYLERRTAVELTKAFAQTARGDHTNANRERFWAMYQDFLRRVENSDG